jgi:hypothetical protein
MEAKLDKLSALTEQQKRKTSAIIGFLRRSKKSVLLVIVVAAATLVLSAGISIVLDGSNPLSSPSIGNIHTVGVKAYWDANLTKRTTGIQWGTVYTGSSYTTLPLSAKH